MFCMAYLILHNIWPLMAIAFRRTGGCEQLGNFRNGLFLSLIELLSKYNPILSQHVLKIKSKEIKNHFLGKDI